MLELSQGTTPDRRKDKDKHVIKEAIKENK